MASLALTVSHVQEAKEAASDRADGGRAVRKAGASQQASLAARCGSSEPCEHDLTGSRAQEAEAAASVTGQMEAFRGAMVKDGASQRGEVQRIVQGLTKRAQALVDDTLQVCPAGSGRLCQRASVPR